MNTHTKHIRPLTYRQMRAIECWIRNWRKSKAQAIREAGYSEAVAHQPHKIFNSPAVQRELELRGYGKRGVSNNEMPDIEALEVATEPTPVVDFPKLTKEQLQLLKERLAEIYWIPDPFARKEETISLTSTTGSLVVDPEQQKNIKAGDTFSL